ncbi:hypothetical protein FF38_13039 [Lucilia cuprina]|uniref:Uncharacterized protein n=1 Tax=Lucilia cuprina TaxID=7375 RepID=A0A0L0CEY8_LUCCU|nr:hypothetical protein FF38_13039 [Lucilia cuprina]
MSENVIVLIVQKSPRSGFYHSKRDFKDFALRLIGSQTDLLQISDFVRSVIGIYVWMLNLPFNGNSMQEFVKRSSKLPKHKT